MNCTYLLYFRCKEGYAEEAESLFVMILVEQQPKFGWDFVRSFCTVMVQLVYIHKHTYTDIHNQFQRKKVMTGGLYHGLIDFFLDCVDIKSCG